MAFFAKLFFLFLILMLAAPGNALARTVNLFQNYRGKALPTYWADVVIDSVGAFVDAFLTSISRHPYLLAVLAEIVLFLWIMFKARLNYADAVRDVKLRNEYKMYSSRTSAPNLPLHIIICIFLSAGIILGTVIFSRVFFKNLSHELNDKRTRREAINYNAKTIDEVYKKDDNNKNTASDGYSSSDEQ